MSDRSYSYVEEQLEILKDWDVDGLVEALRITTAELLEVPEFANRAVDYIKANGAMADTGD